MTDVDIRLRGACRRHQGADCRVDLFQRGVRHGRAGAVLVLIGVEADEMQRHKFGALAFDQLCRVAGANGIGGSAFIDGSSQGSACILLQGRDEARRGKRGDQLDIVRRQRAPIFRHVVVDGRIADTHGPADAGDDLVLGVHLIPQGRDLDVARIPVPAFVIFIQRIERDVVGNAVQRRCHAGDERGVVWIGDGRQHIAHARGIGAVFQEGAQVRHFQSAFRGVDDVRRAQAVDGDHQNRIGLGRPDCQKRRK